MEISAKLSSNIRTAACIILAGLIAANAFARSPQAASAQPSPQTAPQTTAPAPAAKVDPAKEAAIRKLWELTGASALMTQTMDQFQGAIRESMLGQLPPGAYRDRLIDLFIVKFRAKANNGEFLNLLLPIYDKYLSLDDINGMIAFYATPLGQKTLTVMPKVSLESQQTGMQWGEMAGRQSMQEVLAEHPDLAQQLQDAAKGAAPRPPAGAQPNAPPGTPSGR